MYAWYRNTISNLTLQHQDIGGPCIVDLRPVANNRLAGHLRRSFHQIPAVDHIPIPWATPMGTASTCAEATALRLIPFAMCLIPSESDHTRKPSKLGCPVAKVPAASVHVLKQSGRHGSTTTVSSDTSAVLEEMRSRDTSGHACRLTLRVVSSVIPKLLLLSAIKSACKSEQLDLMSTTH